MIIQLPLSNDLSQDFVTQLGSTKYEFLVNWNDRANFWTMDIIDYVSQKPLILGMPLLLGCDLLGPFNINNGALIMFDETGMGQDAGYADLGSRVTAYWFSADEVDHVRT